MSKDFRKLRDTLISCSLILSCMLTACSEKSNSKKIYADDTYTYTEICYNEDGTIIGTLPISKIDKFVKIVTFKQGDITFTRLVAIEDHKNGSIHAPHYRIVKYADLDTGTTLIHYTNGDVTGKTSDHISYVMGEYLEIVEVKDFLPYIFQEGRIQETYDINDILAIYHEKVEPTLTDNYDVVLN